jgi:hypothetical protein
MNVKESIELEILSPKLLLNKEDMLRVVRLQCELLPQYLLQKWDWQEPLRHIFDPAHLEAIIHANGNTETTIWKRMGKARANGHWATRWANGMPNQM